MDKTNLTSCRDCGQSVSKTARACPHCGASKPWKQPRGKIRPDFWVALIFVIALAVALVQMTIGIGIDDGNGGGNGGGNGNGNGNGGGNGNSDGNGDGTTTGSPPELAPEERQFITRGLADVSIGGTLYVEADLANLRESGSMDAPVVLQLRKGHRLTLFERQGDWYSVGPHRQRGETGWIHWSVISADYVAGNPIYIED